MKNLLTAIALLCALSVSCQQTIIIPPSKDTTKITIALNVTTVTVPGSIPNVPPPVVIDSGSIPAGYVLSYKNGYNSFVDLVTDQKGEGVISNAVVYAGAGSFNSIVSGAVNSSGSFRSEQQYTGTAQNPTEGIARYKVYFDKAFTDNGHSFQWHPNNNTGSATLALWHINGKFEVVRSLSGSNYYQHNDAANKNSIAAIQEKHWYVMEWQYKFTTATNGYIKLFIDGKLYFSFVGKTSDGGQYVKIGQNIFFAANAPGSAYYDDLEIYKKL